MARWQKEHSSWLDLSKISQPSLTLCNHKLKILMARCLFLRRIKLGTLAKSKEAQDSPTQIQTRLQLTCHGGKAQPRPEFSTFQTRASWRLSRKLKCQTFRGSSIEKNLILTSGTATNATILHNWKDRNLANIFWSGRKSHQETLCWTTISSPSLKKATLTIWSSLKSSSKGCCLRSYPKPIGKLFRSRRLTSRAKIWGSLVWGRSRLCSQVGLRSICRKVKIMMTITRNFLTNIRRRLHNPRSTKTRKLRP